MQLGTDIGGIGQPVCLGCILTPIHTKVGGKQFKRLLCCALLPVQSGSLRFVCEVIAEGKCTKMKLTSGKDR